jgi:hypothetical protein
LSPTPSNPLQKTTKGGKYNVKEEGKQNNRNEEKYGKGFGKDEAKEHDFEGFGIVPVSSSNR